MAMADETGDTSRRFALRCFFVVSAGNSLRGGAVRKSRMKTRIREIDFQQ